MSEHRDAVVARREAFAEASPITEAMIRDVVHGFYGKIRQDPTLGPISRFFNGEADSNVGLQAGLTRDIWTVVNPDLTPLQGQISRGDSLFAAAIKKTGLSAMRLPPAQAQAQMNDIWQLRDEAIVGIASRYVSHPWPINFLLIVDPLVTWIWIGALIVAFGGLIALWPVPAVARRRRVRAPAPARPPAPTISMREPAAAGVREAAAVRETA